jgi:hypothetical protein
MWNYSRTIDAETHVAFAHMEVKFDLILIACRCGLLNYLVKKIE